MMIHYQPAILIYTITPSCIIKTIDRLLCDGFLIKVVSSEFELFEVINKKLYDVVFIDLDVNPSDGITLITHLHTLNLVCTPLYVIFSNKKDEYIQELALNSGSDAYINFFNKPTLLSSYTKSLVRRKSTARLQLKNRIEIFTDEFLIRIDGKKIQLSKKEFEIFNLLAKNAKNILSRKELACQVWNDEFIALKRNIDVHICNIRKHIYKDVVLSSKNKGYVINTKYNISFN